MRRLLPCGDRDGRLVRAILGAGAGRWRRRCVQACVYICADAMYRLCVAISALYGYALQFLLIHACMPTMCLKVNNGNAAFVLQFLYCSFLSIGYSYPSVMCTIYASLNSCDISWYGLGLFISREAVLGIHQSLPITNRSRVLAKVVFVVQWSFLQQWLLFGYQSVALLWKLNLELKRWGVRPPVQCRLAQFMNLHLRATSDQTWQCQHIMTVSTKHPVCFLYFLASLLCIPYI